MTDVLELTRALLAIPSPTGREHAVTDWLAGFLESTGWHVDRQPVRDGRENIYAHRGAPEVVFSTHLDTVPPDVPFSETATHIHGRGACDAKGIAAAMVVAAEVLIAGGEDRIGLLFVVGEENGSDGAKVAFLLEPKGHFIVNGEPTENRVVTGQKGVLRVTLEARGVAAHSGYPELGDSAIDRLLDALAAIRQIPWPSDPILGLCTLNVGRIEGGAAPNVIAPSARAELMVRLIGDAAPIREAITAAAGDRVAVEFPLEIPILRAPALPGYPATTVAYGSDLPFFAAWGTGYQLGPGTIHLAHTDHENIAKQELIDAVAQYVEVARTLLAGVVT
ncbi:MAG: M20/M25/M40 family metallo-hydrolase [Gemmatimonadales bacterium]